MSRFPGRTASVLVVVDAQQAIAAELAGRARLGRVLADLVSRARLAGTPVIWLRRRSAELRVGRPGWLFVDELVPEPAELLVDHHWDDAFIDTGLAEELAGLGAGHLWLAGYGSDTAVLHTYLGALHRGFDVTLIEDAHAAPDAEFDAVRWPAEVSQAFVNRVVWRDLEPDVTGNLMAAANVEFAGQVMDDEQVIAQAEAETDDE